MLQKNPLRWGGDKKGRESGIGKGEPMLIKLCAIDENLALAWENVLCQVDVPQIEVFRGDILDSGCGAVVSPANSFGFMDGGVDLLFSRYFGWGVQAELQQKLQKRPLGELLVGEALAVETNDVDIPYLISAPTMRVPDVIGFENISLACRAAIITAKDLPIDTIAFPGMGTGCGNVPYGIAAPAMIVGLQEGLEPPHFPRSLKEVYSRGFKEKISRIYKMCQ